MCEHLDHDMDDPEERLTMTGICEQCGDRVSQGMPDFWASESGVGLMRAEDYPPEANAAALREVLELTPCPRCGGPLKVPSTSDAE